MRGNDGLDQEASGRDGEKWSDSGCNMNVEMKDLADRSHGEYKGKRFKNDFQIGWSVQLGGRSGHLLRQGRLQKAGWWEHDIRSSV